MDASTTLTHSISPHPALAEPAVVSSASQANHHVMVLLYLKGAVNLFNFDIKESTPEGSTLKDNSGGIHTKIAGKKPSICARSALHN